MLKYILIVVIAVMVFFFPDKLHVDEHPEEKHHKPSIVKVKRRKRKQL